MSKLQKHLMWAVADQDGRIVCRLGATGYQGEAIFTTRTEAKDFLGDENKHWRVVRISIEEVQQKKEQTYSCRAHNIGGRMPVKAK